MPGDERLDVFEGEEHASIEDEEQRDGSAAGQEDHSKQHLERVEKALVKPHTNLRHPGVKEMVLDGRASELAIQQARRRHCDVCAENVQPNFPTSNSYFKCWTSVNVSVWTFGACFAGMVSQNQ